MESELSERMFAGACVPQMKGECRCAALSYVSDRREFKLSITAWCPACSATKASVITGPTNSGGRAAAMGGGRVQNLADQDGTFKRSADFFLPRYVLIARRRISGHRPG